MKAYIKKFFARPPLKIAGDLLFWGLLVLMVIPSTRSVIFSGVAKIRALVIPVTINRDDAPFIQEGSWDWQLIDQNGNQVSMADFKGEVLLINQWATWCPPCRAEMPSLQKLYERMGDKVTFLLVSTEEPDKIRDYNEKHDYTFPWYVTKEAPPQVLQSKNVPTTHLVSKDGQIVLVKKGAYDWNAAKIRKILNQLAQE